MGRNRIKNFTRVDNRADTIAVLPQPAFSLTPSPVVYYVMEEVSRQGHDVRSRDGIERVSWMLEAWAEALIAVKLGQRPTVASARMLGRLIEPEKNDEGFRSCGVRVGSRVCPPPDRVAPLLTTLFEQRDVLSPLEFYKGFEEIHPFRDGNGRTGKIILNWLNGSLLDPVFPPSNLWGRDIRNP